MSTRRIAGARETLEVLSARFAMERYLRRIAQHDEQLQQQRARLRASDPATALRRGYALVYDQHGKLLTSTRESTVGMRLRTRLWDGTIDSTVNAKREERSDE